VGTTEAERPDQGVVVSTAETQAYARLAFRWHRTGNYDRARAMYELVLETVDSPVLTFNLAVCLIRVGDYESALLRLAELAEVQVRDPALRYNARYHRALAHRYLASPPTAESSSGADVPPAASGALDPVELDLALKEAEGLARDAIQELIERTTRDGESSAEDTALSRLAAPALMLYNAVLFETSRTAEHVAMTAKHVAMTDDLELTTLAQTLLQPEPLSREDESRGMQAAELDPAAERVKGERQALQDLSALMSSATEKHDTDEKQDKEKQDTTAKLLAAVPAYVRTYRPADRRARYNLACFLAEVAHELRGPAHAAEPGTAERPTKPEGTERLAQQLLGRAVGDLRVATSDLSLLEWARADPSLQPVRQDPRGALLVTETRPTTVPPPEPEPEPDDGSPPAPPPTAEPEIPSDPPPAVRDAAYWLRRPPQELVALQLRPVRDDGKDAFLAAGQLGLAAFDETSALRRHFEQAGTASPPPGLEESLPHAVILELGDDNAMLLLDPEAPQLVVAQRHVEAHRADIDEFVEYLLTLIRRTEDAAHRGQLQRSTGYPRDGLELSAWTERTGHSEPVTLGLHDPADSVRARVNSVLSPD
jgi:hypothetical protein